MRWKETDNAGVSRFALGCIIGGERAAKTSSGMKQRAYLNDKVVRLVIKVISKGCMCDVRGFVGYAVMWRVRTSSQVELREHLPAGARGGGGACPPHAPVAPPPPANYNQLNINECSPPDDWRIVRKVNKFSPKMSRSELRATISDATPAPRRRIAPCHPDEGENENCRTDTSALSIAPYLVAHAEGFFLFLYQMQLNSMEVPLKRDCPMGVP
ncbi:hypothetical protein EVAR_21195_1 [Eumeta japonica]|uniref:Uncharacterized protein n=1 Tax=Eumeta variegata TaxID=151549 RepID=A0A4C1UNQ9_EUMVA|nr:hypothetical protein EVAR_21195_1 [Eumeta japonica]